MHIILSSICLSVCTYVLEHNFVQFWWWRVPCRLLWCLDFVQPVLFHHQHNMSETGCLAVLMYGWRGAYCIGSSRALLNLWIFGWAAGTHSYPYTQGQKQICCLKCCVMSCRVVFVTGWWTKPGSSHLSAVFHATNTDILFSTSRKISNIFFLRTLFHFCER